MKKIFILICLLALTGCWTNTVETVIVSNDTKNGNYQEIVLSGELDESYIIDTEGDVVLTLNNVSATLEESVIEIKNANSLTLILEGENTLESTGKEPKAINSDVDLTIKGEGTLKVTSTDTCIKSKGNLTIESGNFILEAGDDGDGLRANENLIINGGNFDIKAGECLEATQITINGGEFTLYAVDDAINASEKSDLGLIPCFTFNDGNLFIEMAQGDTDAVDSNGDIYINGGSIEINAVSAFDWDGELYFNGGKVVINGEEIDKISNQFESVGGFDENMPGNFNPNDTNFNKPNSDNPNMQNEVPPEMPQGQTPPQKSEKQN